MAVLPRPRPRSPHHRVPPAPSNILLAVYPTPPSPCLRPQWHHHHPIPTAQQPTSCLATGHIHGRAVLCQPRPVIVATSSIGASTPTPACAVDVYPTRPGRNSTSVNLLIVRFSTVTAELSVRLVQTDARLVDQGSEGDGDAPFDATCVAIGVTTEEVTTE